MHEFALAEAVLAAALRAAEEEGLTSIASIDVRIGELQRIEKETFEFALREVLPEAEPRLRGTRITLGIERASFRCRSCARRFSLDESGGPVDSEAAEAIHFIPELAHAFMRCPECGSPDFELTHGRGVVIESIEGERAVD